MSFSTNHNHIMESTNNHNISSSPLSNTSNSLPDSQSVKSLEDIQIMSDNLDQFLNSAPYDDETTYHNPLFNTLIDKTKHTNREV